MLILAIETSCDETAASVVEEKGNSIHEISNVLATSQELHEKTGGIVPEVAARKQVESITTVISEALLNAKDHLNVEDENAVLEKIDYIAVTKGPGLIGSLVVGVEAAKALSLATEIPLIGVNHLVGHIYANWVDTKDTPELPAVVLVVSGGHTDLVLMKDHNKLEYLGGTLDDAVGEAFDKTARLLGLKKYLGGPELSNTAQACKENKMEGKLPRPKLKDDDFDFSFSGLKTAVRRIVEEKSYDLESIAKEFEVAATDVLIEKTIRAAKQNDVKTILLGGGVAANKRLRERLKEESDKLGLNLHIPNIKLCGDNATYIGAAAYFNQDVQEIKDIKANPSLGIMD